MLILEKCHPSSWFPGLTQSLGTALQSINDHNSSANTRLRGHSDQSPELTPHGNHPDYESKVCPFFGVSHPDFSSSPGTFVMPQLSPLNAPLLFVAVDLHLVPQPTTE